MNQTIDIRGILQLLPHRFPFVLVDRVLSHDDTHLQAIKNVTYDEPFFPGHFPDVPTMPGVIMLEGMAQACGLLAVIKSGLRPESGLLLYFAGIDCARFKRPVVPGDQLVYNIELLKQKRDLWKFMTRATVDGDLAVEAEMMCVLKKPDPVADTSA